MQKLTPSLFVQLYMESLAAGHTMRQFANRIGMTTGAAYNRVRHYRKRGVKLPALAEGRPFSGTKAALDTVALNAIVTDSVRAMEDAGLPPARRNGRAVATW